MLLRDAEYARARFEQGKVATYFIQTSSIPTPSYSVCGGLVSPFHAVMPSSTRSVGWAPESGGSFAMTSAHTQLLAGNHLPGNASADPESSSIYAKTCPIIGLRFTLIVL